MVELTTKQKAAVLTMLQRIGSWTAARWDQHLRYDVGDEDTDVILKWAHEQLGPGSPSGNDAAIAAAAREYVVAWRINGRDPTPENTDAEMDLHDALIAAVEGKPCGR